MPQPYVIPYPIKTDPDTVQTLLPHSDDRLTLQFYSHAISEDRMRMGEMLGAILVQETNQNGLQQQIASDARIDSRVLTQRPGF